MELGVPIDATAFTKNQTVATQFQVLAFASKDSRVRESDAVHVGSNKIRF